MQGLATEGLVNSQTAQPGFSTDSFVFPVQSESNLWAKSPLNDHFTVTVSSAHLPLGPRPGIALATALFLCAVSVLVPPHENVKLCHGQSFSLLRDSFNFNLDKFLAKESNLSQNRRLVLADHASATVGLPHGGHWVVVDQKDDGIRQGAPYVR